MLVYQHADKVHKVGVKTTKQPVKKNTRKRSFIEAIAFIPWRVYQITFQPFNQSLKLFWLPGLCKVWQKVNSFRINNPAAKFRRVPRHGRHFDKVEPMSLSIKGC